MSTNEMMKEMERFEKSVACEYLMDNFVNVRQNIADDYVEFRNNYEQMWKNLLVVKSLDDNRQSIIFDNLGSFPQPPNIDNFMLYSKTSQKLVSELEEVSNKDNNQFYDIYNKIESYIHKFNRIDDEIKNTTFEVMAFNEKINRLIQA